jgi:hypothetical protein
MKIKITKFILLNLIIISSWKVYALVPLENLELGDFSETYSQGKTDPLNYIFTTDNERTQGKDELKRKLANFRGFYEEAENYKNSCKTQQRIQYPTPWDRTQVKRAHLATLQYLGLDVTVRALVEYAKYFEFSESEFNNFSEGLIGNYCSTNISVISINQLKKNLKIKYQTGDGMQLPSIENNSLFPKALLNVSTKDETMKKEFLTTIELFKSFCSWGGEVKNLRLLTPLVRSPIIHSFISRQMIGKKISWDPINNKYFMSKGETIRVRCENLICRRHLNSGKEFTLPFSVGHNNYYDDYRRLYCEDFSIEDYKLKQQIPKISKIIKQRTMAEDNFLVSQFIALLTGVPDFLLHADSYQQGQDFLRSSVDDTWTKWAKSQTENYKKELYYEEPLTIELVDNEYYFKRDKANFQVIFDINLGEFDKSVEIKGKIKTYFDLKVSRSFLKWIGREWKMLDPRKKKYKKDLLDKFHAQVTDQIQKSIKNLPFENFEGSFEKIIIKEMLSQLGKVNDSFYRNRDKELLTIPISFNFAPFALKYLHYRFQVDRNAQRMKNMQLIFKRRELAKK